MAILKRKNFRRFLIACSSVFISAAIAKYIQFQSVSENTELTSQTGIAENEKISDIAENGTFLQGMWVPYMELDVSKNQDTERAFKENFQNIVNTALEHNINTLVVHVRSHSDALYPSKIFPISHILTGNQGDDTDFDPLKYMVETAHSNNLKFHAWINPLRVSSLSLPTKICDSNPCKSKLFADKLIRHKNGIIYNPAYPEVRDLISNGVKEIVENYEVDAIHFDDYFYPEFKDIISGDTHKLGENTISLRKKHINALIKQVHETIQNTNPNVQFGISPPGNIKKCANLGIDISAWLKENYIEYICPQIYWSLDAPECPFERCLSDWKTAVAQSNTNAVLYIGLALYKACTDADNGTWKKDKKIMAKELELSRSNNSNGVILYSSDGFKSLKGTEELDYLNTALKNNREH